MISFELHGDPEGKARPRAWVAKKRDGTSFVKFYSPKETVTYEAAIAMAAKIKHGSKPLLEGPISILITAYMPVQPSWTQKKRTDALAGAIYPTVKPDWDNIGKIVSDALKGVVWKDDTQVIDARVIKVYSMRPRLSVQIQELDAAFFGGLHQMITEPAA